MTRRQTHLHRRGLWVALAVGAIVALTGCERYHDTEAFVTDPMLSVQPIPYTVSPPDELQMIAARVPEVDGEIVIISPDGTIDLPLLGHIQVAGLTVPEITRKLSERASVYYRDAEVTVRITSFRSKHLYVFGEVSFPGRYVYTGSDSILDVLAQAQPTRIADQNRIQVIRPMGNNKPAKRMTIELEKWIERGEIDRNALLAEGDIVYIPPTGLAEIGLALQQVLLPLQPAAQIMQNPVSIDQSAQTLSQPAPAGN